MPVYMRAHEPPVERALPRLEVRQRIDDDDDQGAVDSLLSRLLPDPTTTRRVRPTATQSDDEDEDDETTTTRGRTTSTSSRSTSSTTRQVAPTAANPPASLPPVTVTSTSANSAATGANNVANGEQTTGSNPGLSPIAIGTIVAASVIFGLICLALVARKLFQARRRAKRGTWAGSIAPFEQGRAEKQPEPVYVAAAASNISSAAYARQQSPRAQSGPQYPNYPTPPAPVAQFSPAAPSSAGFNGAYGGPIVSNDEICVVKMTFTPTLADELPIAKGETIRVLVRHDDGWATCEKIEGGQRGVVPLDCLKDAKVAGANARY